jgi:hypothetical protein
MRRRRSWKRGSLRNLDLRLVDLRNVQWQNRAHFFALCARLMRRILVDLARSRHYAKRGGGAQPVSLDGSLVVSPDDLSLKAINVRPPAL